MSGPGGGAGLAGLRLLLLFLLSFQAVAMTQLVYGGAGAVRAQEMAAWGGALAAAALAGEGMRGRLGSLVNPQLLLSFRFIGWVVHLLAFLFALALATGRDPEMARATVRILCLAQPVMLLFMGLGRGGRGVILNALELVVLASFAGGAPGAAAVCGHTALLAAFLVVDRWHRTLAEYAARDAVRPGPIAIQIAGAMLPAAGMAMAFWCWPPAGADRVAGGGTWSGTSAAGAMSASVDLLIAVLAAGGLFYLLVWLLSRVRRKGPEGQIVHLAVAGRSEEELPAPAPRMRDRLEGHRGRVARAYLRFTEQAAKLGVRRRPDHTPVEFAARTGRAGPALAALTARFMRARYGPDEPTLDEAVAAEREARTAAQDLRDATSA